jgi:hypothetical protein
MGITNDKICSQRVTASKDPLQLVIDTTPALIHTAHPEDFTEMIEKWRAYCTSRQMLEKIQMRLEVDFVQSV